MLKPYTDVKLLVKNEIDQIKKRDGELAKTAYLVIEVASRLKTLAPWEGYNAHKPLTQNLRAIVEAVVHGTRDTNRTTSDKDGFSDSVCLHPIGDAYEVLEDVRGDRKKVGKSVDALPHSCKKEKLKKRLKKVS